MSLDQLIANYGNNAATAPIQGYMKGLQFGSQMQASHNSNSLQNLQLKQDQIKLDSLQRMNTPEYLNNMALQSAQDRQIKNDQIKQVTDASRAEVYKIYSSGNIKERLSNLQELAPILRTASNMNPNGIKDYLSQNQGLLYKTMDKTGREHLDNLFKYGTVSDFKNFAQLGYEGTAAGMDEAQKLALASITDKGKVSTPRPSKEGSDLTGKMIVAATGAPDSQRLDLGSASRGLTEDNAHLGYTQDDISTLMIQVWKDLKDKNNKSHYLGGIFSDTNPTVEDVKTATQKVIDERTANSSGTSTNSITKTEQNLPLGLSEAILKNAMITSGLSRQEVIDSYNQHARN